MPFNFNFEGSVTQQQRLWADSAYLNARQGLFPGDLLTLTFTVRTVPEPPCVGHKDYMCTTMTGSTTADIAIRAGADDPRAPFNKWLADLGPGANDPVLRETVRRTEGVAHLDAMIDLENARRGVPHIDLVRRWFQESFVHEMMHGVTFAYLAVTDEAKTQLASWFRYNKTATGEGERTGLLADWNPLDKPWEDRIQEAVAEFLKDVYLAESARVQDNHTNWDFMEDHFGDLLSMIEDAIGCVPSTST